jgi:hypothetical protein
VTKVSIIMQEHYIKKTGNLFSKSCLLLPASCLLPPAS